MCLNTKRVGSIFQIFKNSGLLKHEISSRRHFNRFLTGCRRTSCAAGEVYYASDDGCYALHQRGPCRMNQQLYEGHRKEGLCDCLPDLGLVYSESDDRCYALNIQVSAKDTFFFREKET